MDRDQWPYCSTFTKSDTRVRTFSDTLPWLLATIGPMDEQWTWRIRRLDNNDLEFYFKTREDCIKFALTWG